MQIHRELVNVEKGAYKEAEPASREANVSTIIGVFLLVLIIIVLAIVFIWLVATSLSKRKQRKMRTEEQSFDPEIEKLKAAEAMRDQQNNDSGWFSGKSKNKSKVMPAEKRKLRPSSIEEAIDEREADEVDHPVYKETTLPG